MITKFNTGAGDSGTSDGGGGAKTVLILGLLVVAGYLIYNHFLKPKPEENQEQQ